MLVKFNSIKIGRRQSKSKYQFLITNTYLNTIPEFNNDKNNTFIKLPRQNGKLKDR